MGQGQNEVHGKSHKWAMTMRSGGFSLEADVSPCSWCSGQPCSWDRLVSGKEALTMAVGLIVTDFKGETLFSS